MMLTAQGVKKKYGNLEVLKGIDLSVEKGEMVAIVGASGAGKSTLLHILGSLDTPEAGEIWLNGVNIANLSADKLAKFRNKQIGIVFQFHNLLPEFTALENICLPALIGGKTQKEAEIKARELAELLNISHRLEHRPQEMSGGEQQRAAVARALINSPAIVFADEPSGNLDSKNAEELHNLFFTLRDKLQQTFVVVTHNQQFAQLANRIIEIKDGKVVA
jgi:lipoprotein-releasing system ATP-binding protein